MTTLREAAQQALDLLKRLHGGCTDSDDGTVEAITVWCPEVIADLEAALEQPEHKPMHPEIRKMWEDYFDKCFREQPVQEPVAYIHRQGNHWEVSERHLCDDEKARGWTEEPLYTAPSQRKPLTDEEMRRAAQAMDAEPLAEGWTELIKFARAIEKAHGIGGSE